jgi:hypothetical protein
MIGVAAPNADQPRQPRQNRRMRAASRPRLASRPRPGSVEGHHRDQERQRIGRQQLVGLVKLAQMQSHGTTVAAPAERSLHR